MKDSDILWGGPSEAEKRLKAENMDMAPGIRIDHNYYAYLQGRAKDKAKELEQENKLSGYEVGFNGKMGRNFRFDDDKNDKAKRTKLAIGGAAKERKGYPATSFTHDR
jgi:hypothetical protein